MTKPRAVDNEENQLERNLAPAFIATCHGIGLDYARKKYAGEPVGEYWITLARKVTADLSKSRLEPQRTPTQQWRPGWCRTRRACAPIHRSKSPRSRRPSRHRASRKMCTTLPANFTVDE